MTETTARRAGLWLAALLWALPAAAQVNPDDLLPVGEAFAISADSADDAVTVSWDIADGYYLYRHALKFTAGNAELGTPELPPGEAITDEFFGETETYRDRVSATIPVLDGPDAGPIELTAHFQGCADVGVCYPPERTRLEVAWTPAAATPVPSGAGAASGAGGIGTALDRIADRDGYSAPPESEALPPEEAFVYEAIALDAGRLLVRFTAAEGYYLYRHAFAFEIPDRDIRVVRSEIPVGEPIVDEYFGETEVYFGEVEIPVHLARPAGGETEIELIADFQGCKDKGICYPPMTRAVTIELEPAESARGPEPAAVDAASSRDLPAAEAGGTVTEQDRLAIALAESPLTAMALFFIAGILLAFTPCVFPMIPILSGLIAGGGERMTTARAFRLSLVYVLAMALVYTAFGVIAGVFGHNLQAVFQNPWVLSAFAALFVALALAMFGFYELQLPASWQTKLSELSNRQEGGTLLGAGIMGALSALVVGPCVAPALMGALIYIGQTGDAVLGGGALFAMALGMGVPLMVWGTSAGKLLPKAGMWMNAVKAVFGVGLLALAIWMLERILPGGVTMLLWGGLAVACGVYLGALSRLDQDASGWRKLWQALGVVLLVLGILEIIGAAAGGRDWLRPLASLTAAPDGTAAAAGAEFRTLDNAGQLDAALAAANGPVLLDFYADWCVECRRMERTTFPAPAVAGRLQDFTLLKIDVTDYTDAHRELLARYGLIGPPAYLFFNDGEEIAGQRLIGFDGPEAFAARLDRVTGR